eukprot:CAMPEP_0172659518 /NCGR_PEP_ID=MMETSP1074-20121228/3485_1 /TAXON_ID=2916 /ORGANISM="Ceratium fusus, Strain PA161109" /LENGTH=136 /DNA_ID=CAMNT_0013475007 /DNA_START=545 /DNA_END=955 /DNA_ORIENTATION=+
MIVPHDARNNERHLGSSLALKEQLLSANDSRFRGCLVAHLEKAVGADSGKVVEERRPCDIRSVELLVKPLLQGIRQQFQDLYMFLVRPHLVSKMIVLQEAPYGFAQVGGNIISHEVDPQLVLLLHQFALLFTQLRD